MHDAKALGVTSRGADERELDGRENELATELVHSSAHRHVHGLPARAVLPRGRRLALVRCLRVRA
jgi:hypothetical protein